MQFSKEQLQAHASFAVQQAKYEATEELHSLQEQAKFQVASVAQHTDANFEKFRQAAQEREAQLMAELQQQHLRSEGQAAATFIQQEQHHAQRCLRAELLAEQEAHVQGLQTRLEQARMQHATSLAAIAGEQGLDKLALKPDELPTRFRSKSMPRKAWLPTRRKL